MVTVPPSTSTVQPRLRRTSAISGTSRLSGQFVRVVVPSASSAAAISFRTLFLAPTTSTDPTRRAPPLTAKCCATTVDGIPCPWRAHGRWAGSLGWAHGRAPDQDLHQDRRRRDDR